MSDTRYQDSPVYVKMYRWLRHMPKVPYRAFSCCWLSRKLPEYDEDGWAKLTWRQHWGICKGLAGVDMNHLYDAEEVFDRVRKKIRSKCQHENRTATFMGGSEYLLECNDCGEQLE